MPRVLVETDKPGWFLDASEPEGRKVRKQDGDQIFDNLIEAQQAMAVLQKAHGPQQSSNGDSAAREPQSRSSSDSTNGSAPEVTAETGKTLKGKTTTIRCSWIDGGNKDGKPYETLKLVSGQTIKGLTPAERQKACGKERTIKTQDLFQARYCAEHREEHHKRQRRERAKRKRQAAKATA